MVKLFDDMAVHFRGEGSEFDRVYLEELQSCFAKYDDKVL
jgi:hypothetical protein